MMQKREVQRGLYLFLIWFTRYFNIFRTSGSLKCTAFTMTDNQNQVHMGRNYDFKLDTSAMLVYCTPPNGYKSVAFAALDNISANTPDESMKKKLATLTSPFICLDGMNEKGVSIAVLTPAYYTAVSTAKLEQRSFCSAQNPASFGVWRSFRWKSIKRKSLKLLGTSRSFRLCYLKIGNLLVNRLHRGELDWW